MTRRLASMPVRTRIALGTLCVFNAAIVAGLGAIAIVFVDGGAGLPVAVAFWTAAAALWWLARLLRDGTDW